jgi:hypothetical protein
VARAARRIKREGGEMPEPPAGATLLPASETIGAPGVNPFDSPQEEIAGEERDASGSGLTSAEEAKRAADSLFGPSPDAEDDAADASNAEEGNSDENGDGDEKQ